MVSRFEDFQPSSAATFRGAVNMAVEGERVGTPSSRGATSAARRRADEKTVRRPKNQSAQALRIDSSEAALLRTCATQSAASPPASQAEPVRGSDLSTVCRYSNSAGANALSTPTHPPPRPPETRKTPHTGVSSESLVDADLPRLSITEPPRASCVRFQPRCAQILLAALSVGWGCQ